MASDDDQLIALVALLRAGGRAWASYILEARRAGGVDAIDPDRMLDEQLGLLAYAARAEAAAEITRWRDAGYRLLATTDAEYPANLRVIDARPPLLFVAGALVPGDRRAVAVIGTRHPSARGRAEAERLAIEMGHAGYTVVSGLAAGIDTEAHTAALTGGHRTLAVIGTGLDHAYPPENAVLQRRIAETGAVVSQFWPESGPSRQSFPARNAVMSGLTLATVIVEAGEHSGTRIQARHALSQGRALILMAPVLGTGWARELAEQPGVRVARTPADVLGSLPR